MTDTTVQRSPHALEQQIKFNLRRGREAAWHVAAAAHEFIEVEGWKKCGHKNLAAWCAQDDVRLSATTFRRYAAAHRDLVIDRQLPPGELHQLDVTVVDVVLPALKRGDIEVDELIQDAKTMSASELRRKHARPNVGDGPTVADDSATDAQQEPRPDLEHPDEPTPADSVARREPIQDLDETGWPTDGHAMDPRPGPEHVEAANSREPSAEHRLADLATAIAAGRAALEQPQRLAGSRQLVRRALQDLIDAAEATL